MALNHLAFSTHQPELTHRFYTEAMEFPIVGIEADDSRGNKYKHCFYDAGDGSYLAYYDLGPFGTKAMSEANSDVAAAMGLHAQYMHVAWEAKDEAGLQEIASRWARCGLEYVESKHHKEWMHSIYTFDPNGLLVECAYVKRQLPPEDAVQAYQIFVEKKGLDEVGYEREGVKEMHLHLPDPQIEKPDYYVPTVKRFFNVDLDTLRGIPTVKIIQH